MGLAAQVHHPHQRLGLMRGSRFCGDRQSCRLGGRVLLVAGSLLRPLGGGLTTKRQAFGERLRGVRSGGLLAGIGLVGLRLRWDLRGRLLICVRIWHVRDGDLFPVRGRGKSKSLQQQKTGVLGDLGERLVFGGRGCAGAQEAQEGELPLPG